MAAQSEGREDIDAYEAWLRQYVKLAEAGRKLAAQLGDDARRRGNRMDEHRFASHAQRLYNEEVYWTLQIQGIAALAAAQHTAAPEPPPARKSAKPAAAANARSARAKQR